MSWTIHESFYVHVKHHIRRTYVYYADDWWSDKITKHTLMILYVLPVTTFVQKVNIHLKIDWLTGVISETRGWSWVCETLNWRRLNSPVTLSRTTAANSSLEKWRRIYHQPQRYYYHMSSLQLIWRGTLYCYAYPSEWCFCRAKIVLRTIVTGRKTIFMLCTSN